MTPLNVQINPLPVLRKIRTIVNEHWLHGAVVSNQNGKNLAQAIIMGAEKHAAHLENVFKKEELDVSVPLSTDWKRLGDDVAREIAWTLRVDCKVGDRLMSDCKRIMAFNAAPSTNKEGVLSVIDTTMKRLGEKKASEPASENPAPASAPASAVAA